MGSSPLTRGKPRAPCRCPSRRGLIPAHAGKTWRENLPAAGAGAHPRSRGENRSRSYVELLREGSSPLTRGKLRAASAVVAGHGLIPAHAGKTCTMLRRKSLAPAHPRSRGENRQTSSSSPLSAGSSPLTRGKLSPPARGGPSAGLIPAHAGKTGAPTSRATIMPAHPRSRGEN